MGLPADKECMAGETGRRVRAGTRGAPSRPPGITGLLARLAGDAPERRDFVLLVGLLLAAAAFPVAEIFLFVWLGSLVGNFLVIAVAVAGSACGALAARRPALGALSRMREALGPGRPACGIEDVVECGGVLLGAVLLAVPGFLTDVVGGALLVPSVRRRAARLIAARYSLKIR
jgi:UPF0716 family protein affecting phage T7 exclusion